MKIAKIIFSILASLTLILLTVQSLRAQAYKWIDDKGNMHFTDDYGQIPEKYKYKMKKINEWGKKSREQNTGETKKRIINREETNQEINNQEQAGDTDGDTDYDYVDICMERERHLAKARELFPNERSIDKYWEMYRQQYMTEEERILIPARISTDHPCDNRGQLIVPAPRR
jgi:hypothetical protein